MIRVSLLGVAASALLIASPASAESWWVVDQPGARELLFVDADSISVDGEVRVMRVTADGAEREELRSVRCADANDAVEAFVCADDATRMETAAMLGSLTPELAAKAIFSVEG